MSRGVNANDGYLEALVKNMPSETVGGYLATTGMVSGSNPPVALLWAIWGIFLVATPLYLWLMKPGNESSPRPWWQVWIFSPVAFLVWSMTTGGPWAGIENAALIGGVMVLILSAVIFPLISMAIAKASR